jgi:hypothetical protein
MGRQVNFYMLSDDEYEFLDFVTSKKELKIIREDSRQPGLHIIEDYHVFSNEEKFTWSCVIWDQTMPIEPRFFKSQPLGKWNADYRIFSETGEIKYSIDVMNAPVIEYSRSGINQNGVLTRGRIYVQLYELLDGNFYYKGKQLEDLYSRLARWLRRNLIRVEEIGWYAGKKALEWIQSGGERIH